MRTKNGLKTLLFGILTFLVLGAHPGETAGKKLDATIDQLQIGRASCRERVYVLV